MSSISASNVVVRFGAFEADLRGGELRRDGIKVRIQDLPFRALTLFLSRPGEIISRDQLRQALWPNDVFVDFDQGISSAIRRLRDALGDSADNPIFIKTVERRGYCWIAPVHPPESERPKPSEEALALGASAASPSIGSGWRKLVFALPVAALLFAIWIYRPIDRSAKAGAQPITSIAILPFDNLSAPAFDDAFSDGLTDEVAASISHLQSVQVTGRHSAYMFKGKHADLREIGSRLNVEAVVEGSVQRSGDRTHVTVELNRTRDGVTIWSQTYDGTTADWFQIETQIAGSIARNLAHSLTPMPSTPAVRDPEAHALYLEARYLWSRRTYPDELKSVDLLQQAIARDPNYSLAWAGLADSLIAIGNVEEVNPAAYLPRARDAALKALQLDPTLAEAHAALGNVACHYDYDWPTAEREYKKAIELNQSYPSAHQYYALGLMAHGRLSEAEAQLALARRLDPLAYIVDVDLAMVRKYQRDYDGVISVSQGILDRDPNFLLAYNMLTIGYFDEHRYEDYLAADVKATAAKNPGDPVNRELARGDIPAARRELQKLIEQANTGLVRPSRIAGAANHLHDRELTLEWLEKSYDHRDYWELFINVDPEFEWLHNEPRFQALVEKLGLA
jgi:TolB-like protein/DNA-binding winged helix-turn-helix (wHTH) protein